MADMGHQFWTSDGKLSMIGQGRNVVALIAIVFAVAILAAASRRLKARIAVIGALSGVCFLGYNLMLALSYGFIFVPFQAEQLVDYNRYIYSYYIGWFILALGCLSVALLPQITVKGGPMARQQFLLRSAASRTLCLSCLCWRWPAECCSARAS